MDDTRAVEQRSYSTATATASHIHIYTRTRTRTRTRIRALIQHFSVLRHGALIAQDTAL